MKTAREWTAERTRRLWHDTINATKPMALLDFIVEVQADALESAAKVALGVAERCDDCRDPTHFCELFGCHDFVKLAERIREMKPCAEA